MLVFYIAGSAKFVVETYITLSLNYPSGKVAVTSLFTIFPWGTLLSKVTSSPFNSV